MAISHPSRSSPSPIGVTASVVTTDDLEVDSGTLSVDADNNRVGIGLTDPDTTLEVLSTSAQQKWSYDADSFATLSVADASHTTITTGEATGDLILDADDIILDSHEGKWRFKRNTTMTCLLSTTTTDGSNMIFDLQVSDADFIVKGSDGGVGVTALTLDMSDGGAAIFDSKAVIGTGAQADTYLNFDGNAVDFRIGIDDGNDQLEIGKGVAHGTTPAIIISSTPQVVTTTAFGQSTGGTFGTFSDGDATPSVGSGNLWKHHASTQTITMFDNGVAGQVINVISTADITYDVTSTNLKGGSVDLVTASGDVTQWFFDGTNWYLTYFMDVSADHSVIGGGGGVDANNLDHILHQQVFS